MNIPPFPAQDLAKLVLGYLAEEQLMTAYDEFLSASPYLDAMRNEYDRIFMTSLKNILAEYRAVKIYVEACKPYSLRRRLFGCTNLLEIVKFLVQNVDVSKLQVLEENRGSLEKRLPEKCTTCAVCQSLQLASCKCTGRHTLSPANTQSNVEALSLDSSIEATSLGDLPGNHVTSKKKQVKTLPKDSKLSQSLMNSDSNIVVNVESNVMPGLDNTLSNDSQKSQTRIPVSSNDIRTNSASEKCDQVQNLHEVEPFSVHTSIHHRTYSKWSGKVISPKVSMAGSFQEFTKGVQGGENVNLNVPDSSTSENLSSQTTSTKDECIPASTSNAKPVSKAHIFLTVGTIKSTNAPLNTIDKTATNPTPNLRSKPTDSKVTILSDIKVDKAYNKDSNMPVILKNATSTPLMHMQTILINGTTVYKQAQPSATTSRNYTKDEIMAMPTIIVVPTSGASQVPPTSLSEAPPQPADPLTTTSSSAIEPLVIDVPSSSPVLPNISNNMPLLEQPKGNETTIIVTTLDSKMVSAPKDCGEPSNKNTPQGLPPVKKSSSTPRRTSHVRVLDFTTPRRILQEAIGENTAEGGDPIEAVISKSPNIHTLADSASVNVNDDHKTNITDNAANSSESSKENDKLVKTLPPKKNNWDASLRVLAIPNNKEDIPISRIQPRCRPRSITSKSKVVSTDKKSKGMKGKKNSNKSKNIIKLKSEEVVEEPIIIVDDNSNVPLKPTINIITAQDRIVQENDKNQNHKTNTSEPEDTPEMDRLSLQNAIGVKLNISDLLETPYKQAIYDIQMETPRFMGPDLPDEPLSDIKIMNIPTPRFFDTPKPVQATPSSYSSRPTDYSSGGSYYKPDDQDYIPVADLGYPAPVPEEKEVTSVIETDESNNKIIGKLKSGAKSRPVRKCAKNVSYYNNIPQVNKAKELGDKIDVVSTCSDTISLNSSIENKLEKESVPKPVKESKAKTKRTSTCKKDKSPLKRDTSKSFMKIKPRRVTPTKETVKGRARQRRSEEQPRKTKDKNYHAMPSVVSAPTKSRRKSSTPRKLHCTKNLTSESSGHESPEITSKVKLDAIPQDIRLTAVQDSDTEQVQLHWSDDGSQDTKGADQQTNVSETEDISKIQEFINSGLRNADAAVKCKDCTSHLHVDLPKSDVDAAIVEKDSLEPSAGSKETILSLPPAIARTLTVEAILEKTLESDTSSNLKIVQEVEDECEEIELTVSECHEESENYITCSHDDLKETPRGPIVNLKDKFSMEVCIDDDLTVRLRATPITTIFDKDPHEIIVYDEKETEMAVNSISNIDKLYTPMKDTYVREQVYNIFESTLTSLDTPLKANSPKRKECDTTVTEIILEVEKVEDKVRPDDKKRKRLHSVESNDSASSSKKSKPETQYLANMQNIDIETVLSKLHGS